MMQVLREKTNIIIERESFKNMPRYYLITRGCDVRTIKTLFSLASERSKIAKGEGRKFDIPKPLLARPKLADMEKAFNNYQCGFFAFHAYGIDWI